MNSEKKLEQLSLRMAKLMTKIRFSDTYYIVMSLIPKELF